MRSYNIMNGRALIFIFCFMVTISSGQQDEHALCRRRDTSVASWTCKRIADCKLSVKLLNTTQEYRCGSDKRQAKICCPSARRNTTQTKTKSPPNYIRIANEKCTDFAKARYQNVCVGGELIFQEPMCSMRMKCKLNTENIIRGGHDAWEKEFPHMALIGYGEELKNVEWLCGGSLISERFILTAAHCTMTPKPVKWAGLGLVNRQDYTPAVLNKNIFPIAKVHVHRGYKKPLENNDIALFELQDPLEFSLHIRPVCLHTEPTIPEKALLDRATVLGWGFIGGGFDVSDVLLKGPVAILPTNSCKASFADEKKLQNGFDSETMICGRETGDNCRGDSGGPIQINHQLECMYLQVGIISLGSVFCGDGTPAIYTRVYPYLKWIQETVWPE